MKALITRIRFEWRLYRRKLARPIQSQCVKAGISAARRKAWANDPLRGVQ
jgi:hypothetical protein